MDAGSPAVAEAEGVRGRRRGVPAALWLLAIPAAFLGVFAVYPLQGIVRASFFREGTSLSDLHPLVADGYFLGRAWFTLWQAVVSTVVTIALALPCAWAIGRHEFRGKSLVLAVITVPFVLPTIVVAVAFTALVGPQGVLNEALQRVFELDAPPIGLLNTVWLILLAHVFYNFAVASRIIAASWARVDVRLEDAAAILGAGRWTTFRRVTLPLLRPAILAAASLVFLFCFTSFGVVLILGGARYGTIETEIYRETVFLFRLPVAATLALLQMAFTFVVMAVYTRLQAGTRGAAVGGGARRVVGGAERIAVWTIVAVMLVLTLLPLFALVERSLHGPGGYTFAFYRALAENSSGQAIFVDPAGAIAHSLGFAMLTLAFAVPIGTLAAYGASRAGRYGTLAEAVLLLPLGISAITLALGFIVTLDKPPVNLRGSWWLVVVAHTLVAYPFVARSVGVQLRGMDPGLREAARVLGANGWRVWLRVDLPLVWRAMAVGAVFAFAVSMGEFGATLLISRPEWATMPVAIFRYLGRPGAANYGAALAMSTILMGVTTVGFVVIDRLRFREIGTF